MIDPVKEAVLRTLDIVLPPIEKHIEALTAENERLREALRIIRSDCGQLAFAQWLADNALEQEQ